VAPRVENIFADVAGSIAEEQFLTLFENAAVKVERIVSHSHKSPPGFWYDQAEDEWVVVLRGHATLEFEGGELFEMKEGDHVAVPGHVRHRVRQTGPETIWLAVHVNEPVKGQIK
jgi:cupin 2 domain-containing protein